MRIRGRTKIGWRRAAGTLGLLVLGGCRGCGPLPSDPSAFEQACHARFGFTTEARVSFVGDNCPLAGCGLNGAWLGRGFQLRELRQDGKCTAEGLHIKRFSKAGETLALHVDRGALVGLRDGREPLTGLALAGAEIELERLPSDKQGTCDEKVARNAEVPGSFVPEATYRLEIKNIQTQPFWVERVKVDSDPTTFVYLYDFLATELGTGCEIALCKPGLADEPARNVSGTAVIFRGDTYSDDLKVSIPVAPDVEPRFNVACLGTTVSKMHMLGHTAAAETATAKTQLAERQMLMRMLTGDFCGTGVALTDDGVPLKIDFANPRFVPTPASRFALPGRTVEALWTERGASCVGTLRAAGVLRKKIEDQCPQVLQVACPAPPAMVVDGAPQLGVSMNP